jgi:CelD/BcsL family acetyltransferase involved in cellulose biosynthesis
MIETLAELGEFERLGEQWRELQLRSSSRSLFSTWEWLFTWWKHLSAGRHLNLLVVRQAGQIAAIAPLSVRPSRVSKLLPFRALELLGRGSVGSDYLDLIVGRGTESEAIEEIAGHLHQLRLPMELPQVLLNGSKAGLLAQRLAPRGWRVSSSATNVCPYINLAGHDWASYAATLGTAHRANLGRRIRGLEKVDDVRLEAVSSEKERHTALDHMMALHNARWKQLGGSDAFDTPEIAGFHHEFSAVALRNGWLRLMVLRVGAVPVAYLYGFRHESVFYFYQSAFDPAWSDRSVGLVAMGLAIRSAIEEGAGEFDLLHGGERYKRHWAKEERAIGRVDIHPPLIRGWITSGAAELGRAARVVGRSLLSASGRGPVA